MKKNVSSQSIGAEMITSADGSDFTGTVTVLITKDNGTQSASGGTAPAHEGNGYHSYSPTQAETNADHIAFTFTGSGAITHTVQVYTMFPQTVDNATNISAILTDTGTTIPAQITALNDIAATDIVSSGAITTSGGAVSSVTTVATTTTVTGGATSSALATVDTNVDAILVDTGTTIPAQITALNDVAATDIVSSGAITTSSGAVSNVTLVATTTDLTNAGSVNVTQIAGSTTAATQLALSTNTIVSAAAASGTLSVTQMTSTLTETTDDHYIGRIIIWTSGNLQNQATDITDYSGTSGLLTFTSVTEAPSAADTFIIV